jgi:hypothetical protein
MSIELTFDEASHVYRVGGQVVSSVTQILGRLSAEEYRFVDKSVMEDAALLGKAVHKMIELDLRGDLDFESLSDGLQVYYTAWQNFLQLSGFQMVLSEARVYSSKYGYAGTLDLAGWLNNRFVIIDAKRTAAVPRTAGPQTAGYLQALREHAEDAVMWPQDTPVDRYALHLRAEGTWRLVPFTDKSDLRVFLACKTLHDWSNAA